MTRKQLRLIIMAAAEEAVKGKRRADGSNKWIILSVRKATKGGYGLYWIKFQAPTAFVASLFPNSTYDEPHNELHHLGDVVATAQRRFDQVCLDRLLRKPVIIVS